MNSETIKVYLYKGNIYTKMKMVGELYKEEVKIHLEKLGLSRHTIIDREQMERLRKIADKKLDSMEYKSLTNSQYNTAIRTGTLPSNPPSLPEVKMIISENKSDMAGIEKEIISKHVVDDSYENFFGLINDDAEDFIGGLFRTRGLGKNTIASHIESEDRLTVSRCKELLSLIHPESYNDKQRKQFVGLNYRLSHLGVAPRWRGINRDGHYKFSKRERTPEQEAFLRDVQVFDMEWIHKRYHGHLVDTSWNGTMEGIFTSENFDSKKSAIISEMAITPAKKADYLMLTSDMQKELMMLRTKKVDDLIRGLLDQSKRVHNDLMNCARRNKRKGKKLMENLPVRVDLWLASKLNPGGSMAMLIETYRLITGTQLTKSNCQRLLLSLNDSLNEVNSKYVLN
tara:strand:+ start:267 stop:1460 length:1194 start_codon:yes stop_codon:yes gene_type:complete